MAVTSFKRSLYSSNPDKYISFLAGNAAFNPSSYESIATYTLASDTASVSFTSIASSYVSLQLRILERSAGAGTGFASGRMQVNSDTGSNYTYHYLMGDGSSATAYGEANSTAYYQYATSTIPLNGNTSNLFGVSIIDIHDYASTTKNKTFRGIHGLDRNGTGKILLDSCVWRSTSAITTLTLSNGDGNWLTGSVFSLYGIKGA